MLCRSGPSFSSFWSSRYIMHLPQASRPFTDCRMLAVLPTHSSIKIAPIETGTSCQLAIGCLASTLPLLVLVALLRVLVALTTLLAALATRVLILLAGVLLATAALLTRLIVALLTRLILTTLILVLILSHWYLLVGLFPKTNVALLPLFLLQSAQGKPQCGVPTWW
jgi:hypothetical protein